MHGLQVVDRRTFLADLGRGAFALAVVTVAGCGPSASASPGGSTVASASAASSAGSSDAPPSSGAPASEAPEGSAPPSGEGSGFDWERVNLGFVSAYILVRAGEATIVDTGVAGSADAIEGSLSAVGLDWSTVGQLILTHHHGDHAGSAADILERAPEATGYAGAEDIPSIVVPRPLTTVGDGDDVAGLTIITTPGHTPGSISVFDSTGGLLVAGDAIRTEGGSPALPGAEFTEDMDQAKQSVVKLGGLAFETLLVGHGEPIEGGAAAAVAALGAAS
jgi:glyoxylase-like metal-dependent hydrolase (beta-lactamase superfamily II)